MTPGRSEACIVRSERSSRWTAACALVQPALGGRAPTELLSTCLGRPGGTYVEDTYGAVDPDVPVEENVLVQLRQQLRPLGAVHLGIHYAAVAHGHAIQRRTVSARRALKTGEPPPSGVVVRLFRMACAIFLNAMARSMVMWAVHVREIRWAKMRKPCRAPAQRRARSMSA